MKIPIIRKILLYSPFTAFKYALIEIRHYIYYRFIRKSYSQTQEDLIIDKILKYKPYGFYVDIGANDPVRFNNTKRFYRRGWRGINIEPNFIQFQKLCMDRPEDINLNIGIAETEGTLKFYKMFPDTVSTFSAVEHRASLQRGLELDSIIEVPVQKLATIFKEKSVENIDFLSIDTEGYDYAVLKSNNWKKYRPRVICIESIPRSKDARTEKQHVFLTDHGYKRAFRNKTNDIYIDAISAEIV